MPFLRLSAEATFEKDDTDLGSQSSRSTQKKSSVRFIATRRRVCSCRFSAAAATKLELPFYSFLALQTNSQIMDKFHEFDIEPTPLAWEDEAILHGLACSAA